MDTLSSIILGVVQGLTEFLPISSSGHLVLFQNLLGFHEPELLLDTSLHIGTLLAVILFFRRDIAAMAADVRGVFLPGSGPGPRPPLGDRLRESLLTWVVVGNIPTALIGVIFKDPLERLFGSTTVVGVMLLVTGTLLAATRLVPEGSKRLGIFIALAIGVAQGLAIIPGISRSGATIACGALLGLDKVLAARFSFLLSIPAILGALLLQLVTKSAGGPGLSILIVGGITAAVVGLLALKILMRLIRGGRFALFAPYCWAVGIVVLLVAIF